MREVVALASLPRVVLDVTALLGSTGAAGGLLLVLVRCLAFVDERSRHVHDGDDRASQILLGLSNHSLLGVARSGIQNGGRGSEAKVDSGAFLQEFVVFVSEGLRSFEFPVGENAEETLSWRKDETASDWSPRTRDDFTRKHSFFELSKIDLFFSENKLRTLFQCKLSHN